VPSARWSRSNAWRHRCISEHRKAEEAKAEAQRERIRNKELQRIEDEADAKAVVEPAAAPIRTAPPAKTRRLTSQSIDPSAEREELRQDIRRLESQIEDDSDELENLRDDATEACGWIKRAMDPEDRELSLNALFAKSARPPGVTP
jgi:hypothetical protein